MGIPWSQLKSHDEERRKNYWQVVLKCGDMETSSKRSHQATKKYTCH
jgi:hypothetical protein